MTAPQEACEAVFDAVYALADAISVAIQLDDEITDKESCVAQAWLRKDGVSVSYAQDKPNELTFMLQVPMDTILAAQAAADREQGTPA